MLPVRTASPFLCYIFMSLLNMDTVPDTAVDKVMVIDKEMDTDSNQDRTNVAGQPWQDSQDRTWDTVQRGQTAEEGRHGHIGLTSWPKAFRLKVSLYRTKRTGWPGHFSKGQDCVTIFRKCIFL
jgi:hypothetical protein